ncbi:CocE/NonD family hydrolase [Thermodesulfobacteriota bacterium]
MAIDNLTVRGPLPPGVKLDENIYVTMRDGIKIVVDVYRPEAEGRYPALQSMSPYIKEIQQHPPILTHSIEAGATGFFVPKGYVHVIASSRGSGLSQGQYNWYDTAEQQDGYDLCEWIAQQPWCNGNVGMIGDSYFGRTQYLVAAQQPPHLKCIAPYDAGTDDYRDSRHRGGLLCTQFVGMWGYDTFRQCLWPGPVEGKLLPTSIFYNFATNPEDGPYYWERSGWTKIDKIKVPMLAIAPSQGVVHSRGQLWGYPKFNVPKKLIIAPPAGLLAHVLFIDSKPLNEQLLRWLDYWLKGIDTGIMDEPEVAIYDSATKEWRYENEYPLARTKWTKFHLRSNPEGPSTEPPYGLISMEPPEKESPDSFVIPDSIRLIATGQPVLAYATPPLKENLRVWGPLSMILYGSATTLDIVWFVKVADVAPDGQLTMISQGHLKASFKEIDESKSLPGQPFHTFQNPVRPEPNKIYEYQIEMIPIFHTFEAGHKIWVQIASDDFMFHMPLHTIYSSEVLPVPATNTVYHDSKYPSHLLLPIIPDEPIIKPVEPPVSEIKWPLH